jgi:membrane-associated phospholipid phosphatase
MTLDRLRQDRFWLFWAVGLAFAVGLTVLARATSRLPGDLPLARAIQDAPFPARLADALNALGTGWPAILVVIVIATIFALFRLRGFAPLFVAATVFGLVSAPLKILAGRPRPDASLLDVTDQIAGMSFPSGHALHATVSFGLLAFLLESVALPTGVRRALQAGCLLVVLLTGVSRVYVGVHWPSDVLGGYIWGTLIVAALLHVTHDQRHRVRVARGRTALG